MSPHTSGLAFLAIAALFAVADAISEGKRGRVMELVCFGLACVWFVAAAIGRVAQ
jgi:hypothetical protein